MSTVREHNLKERKKRRQRRTRASIPGATHRPRLAVYRSNRFISAQIIDDRTGTTLAAAHERELKGSAGTPTERAHAVGKLIAERAKEKKLSHVVFDRRAYQFHGRVRAVAEGARDGGLIF